MLREQHRWGPHAPPRADSGAPAGIAARTSGSRETAQPSRNHPLNPAAGQRGRSPEHAAARALPGGFAADEGKGFVIAVSMKSSVGLDGKLSPED